MLILKCTKKCELYHKSQVHCNSEVNCMKENLILANCLWFKLLCYHKVNFLVKRGIQEKFQTNIQKNPAGPPPP